MAPRPERRPYVRRETRNPNEVLTLRVAARNFKTIQTEQEDDPENPMVSVAIAKPVGMMELTVMTTAELEAVRTWFNESIDLAAEIVARLDARAAAAAAEGDITYKRLYRSDPVYIRSLKEKPNATTS